MKLAGIIIILAISLYSCCDCDKNKEKPKPVISGKMSWHEWQGMAEWKTYSATKYKPSNDLVGQLKSALQKDESITFVMFSASWCPDSESEVPKFYKLMELCEIPESRITLFGVDRQKKEATGTAQQYRIMKVPTLIILNNNTEIGRVVEFPVLSWEDDLLTILEIINQ